MRIMRRRPSFVMLFVVILLLAFVSVSSFAAEYPKEKAIRILIPYSLSGMLTIHINGKEFHSVKDVEVYTR